MKLFDFLLLFVNRPVEALGRIEGIVDSRLEPLYKSVPKYFPQSYATVVERLRQDLGADLDAFADEPSLADIEQAVRDGIQRLPADAPFARFQNADLQLARLSYVLCRRFRPTNVVETGVCYGVTSSFVLCALAANGHGTLHSIDLPPLGRRANDFVGYLVPPTLRDHWQLHRGASRSVLPCLLRRLGRIDMFMHDSLHTHRNMSRELRIASAYMDGVGIVLCDDIDGNTAFADWVANEQPRFSAVVQERDKASSLLGIAVFNDAAGARTIRPRAL